MSPAQVKNVEEIVNNVINKNQEIYAKEASLAVAKTIQVSILLFSVLQYKRISEQLFNNQISFFIFFHNKISLILALTNII